MRAVLEYPQRHAISAKEYLRMGEAGVFGPEPRMELIEGSILDMTPIGPPHAAAVMILNRAAILAADDLAIVSVQSSLVLDEHSVPTPDLALLKRRADFYCKSHPTAAETMLVVEVSDSAVRSRHFPHSPVEATSAFRVSSRFLSPNSVTP